MKISKSLKILSLFVAAANASTVFTTDNEVVTSDGRVFGQFDVVFGGSRTPPPPAIVPAVDLPSAADVLLRAFTLPPSQEIAVQGLNRLPVDPDEDGEFEQQAMTYALRDQDGKVIAQYTYETRGKIDDIQNHPELELFESSEENPALYIADGALAYGNGTDAEALTTEVLNDDIGDDCQVRFPNSTSPDDSKPFFASASNILRLLGENIPDIMIRDATGKIVATVTYETIEEKTGCITKVEEGHQYENAIFIHDIPLRNLDGDLLTAEDYEEGADIFLPIELTAMFANSTLPIRTATGALIGALNVGEEGQVVVATEEDRQQNFEAGLSKYWLMRATSPVFPGSNDPSRLEIFRWLPKVEQKVKDRFEAAGIDLTITNTVPTAEAFRVTAGTANPDAGWVETTIPLDGTVYEVTLDNITFTVSGASTAPTLYKRTHEGKDQICFINTDANGYMQIASQTVAIDADLFIAAYGSFNTFTRDITGDLTLLAGNTMNIRNIVVNNTTDTITGNIYATSFAQNNLEIGFNVTGDIYCGTILVLDPSTNDATVEGNVFIDGKGFFTKDRITIRGDLIVRRQDAQFGINSFTLTLVGNFYVQKTYLVIGTPFTINGDVFANGAYYHSNGVVNGSAALGGFGSVIVNPSTGLDRNLPYSPVVFSEYDPHTQQFDMETPSGVSPVKPLDIANYKPVKIEHQDANVGVIAVTTNPSNTHITGPPGLKGIIEFQPLPTQPRLLATTAPLPTQLDAAYEELFPTSETPEDDGEGEPQEQ